MTEESQDTSTTPSAHASTPVSPSPTPSLQEIVQKYLPDVQWISPTKGLCLCPGRAKHTSKSTKKDCAVFVEKVPTVYCFHQNCQEEVSSVNDDIRAAWRYFQPEVSPEERQKLLEDSARRHELEARALAAKATILRAFKWDVFQGALNVSLPEQFLLWRDRLWKPDDVIWIGEPHNSGHFFHRAHFSFAEDAIIRGHFTTASCFKAGVYQRSNESVLRTPYLIVEGDAVLGTPILNEQDRHDNKLACAAIFNWLQKELHLKLRAVISSGNKSLHGWFEMPNSVLYDQLKIMLPVMGCDRAMFKPSQPARIPGILRENGQPQTLLYIS